MSTTRVVEVLAVGPGPEDLVLDARHDRLLLSTSSQRPGGPDGGIEALDLPARSNASRRLPIQDRPPGRPPFVPLGLCRRERDDSAVLYVVLMASGGRPGSVERLRIEPGALVFEAAFDSPLLVDPNDVVALEDDEIYVTNGAGKGGLAGRWEQLRKKHGSTVVRHRAGQWAVAANGIGFANGLALQRDDGTEAVRSADARWLRVTAFNERRVLCYERDVASGALTARPDEAVDLDGHPDNLTHDGADLLVAAHLSRWRTLANLLKPGLAAPSAVFRLRGGVPAAEVLRDDGRQISGGSVALSHGGTLYVGMARRSALGVCR